MTGRGVPGTTCKLRVSRGEVPPEGDLLRTARGSCYRVDRVAGKTLHCTRLERDAVASGDEGVWDWRFGPRRRATA